MYYYYISTLRNMSNQTKRDYSCVKLSLRKIMAGVVHTVAIPITYPHRKKDSHIYIKSLSVFCSLKLCTCPYILNRMHKLYYNSGVDCLKYRAKVSEIKNRYVSINCEVDMTQFLPHPLDKVQTTQQVPETRSILWKLPVSSSNSWQIVSH